MNVCYKTCNFFCKSRPSHRPLSPRIVTLVHKNLHSNFPLFRPSTLCNLRSQANPTVASLQNRGFFPSSPHSASSYFFNPPPAFRACIMGSFLAKQGAPGISQKTQNTLDWFIFFWGEISFGKVCVKLSYFNLKYFSSNPL